MDNGQRINIPVPLLGQQQHPPALRMVNVPWADPQMSIVGTPTGLEIFVTGGLTKIEEMALRLCESCEVEPAEAVRMAREIVEEAGEQQEV